MERGHYADMASTGVGFAANSAAKELNPLGWALIPLKASLGVLLESGNCITDSRIARSSNTVTYAASANNLGVAAAIGTTAAPVVGIVTGAAYWFYGSKYHDAIQCEAPAEVQTLIAEFIDAYNTKDAGRIGSLFHDDAQTPNATRRIHIQWTYENVFALHPEYTVYLDRLWWIREGEYLADLRDEAGNWHNFGFTVQNNQILTSTI
jgi:hypothetical protein